MKVAVFGCLHGMLNDMYDSVQRYETNSQCQVDLIIVCGDCQTIRHYDDLKCLSVPHKYKKVGDFHEYYSGQKKIPKLTIFVSGNHEASNYLMTMPYGGWVCDNFYYLGYSGVVRFRGLRIAGVSGIYNFRNSNRGRFECMPLDDQSIRSIYHTRQLDVFRLQLLSKKVDNEQPPIDIFLSHDWPAKIYDHGNLDQLLRFKPLFRSDVESKDGLGSPMTAPLIDQLKPKKWFAAHMHCKFYAKVDHNSTDGQSTEFLSLNKIEGQRRYVEFLDIPPLEDQTDSQQEGDKSKDDETNDQDVDDNLYYDEEWLTILRKTVGLESNSNENVTCPSINDDSSQSYFPSEEDINQTREMMNQTGGLAIKRNFKMVEPVIYGRPDNGNPSIDSDRVKYFLNPQHEELCSRLKINTSLHQHEPSSLPTTSGQSNFSYQRRGPRHVRYFDTRPNPHGNRSNSNHHNHHQRGRGHYSGGSHNRGDRNSGYNQPYKKRAFELDRDGCPPFTVDKTGDK